MPDLSTFGLPPAVRRLPPHAQEVFLSVFNTAWESYAKRGPQQQEEIAFRVGCGAVKKYYREQGESWIPRSC